MRKPMIKNRFYLHNENRSLGEIVALRGCPATGVLPIDVNKVLRKYGYEGHLIDKHGNLRKP